MTDKSIYDLGLHETINSDKGLPCIVRVPGGWIYHSYIYDNHRVVHRTASFVPYSDEFLPKGKVKKECAHRFHLDVKCQGMQCIDCNTIKVNF